jgi:hypothetical protein
VTAKHLIPRLLAGRDRISRLEKEEILGNVLAASAPRRTRWWWAALPALAIAAIVLLVVLPRKPSDEFTARGGGKPVAAFTPSCNPCKPGGTLVFDVHGTTGYRYFAAFSRRSDGTVLWYFPAAGGASVDLVDQPAHGVLNRGIVLGPEHAAGTYHVYGVFSNEPLTREQIRARFENNKLHVVEKEVVVQ